MALRELTKQPTHFVVYFKCDKTWFLAKRSDILYDDVPKVGQSYLVKWGLEPSDSDSGYILDEGSWLDMRRLLMSREGSTLDDRDTPSSAPPAKRPKKLPNPEQPTAKKQRKEPTQKKKQECRVLRNVAPKKLVNTIASKTAPTTSLPTPTTTPAVALPSSTMPVALPMTAVTSTTAPVVATSVPMTTTAPVVATSVPMPTPAVAPPSTVALPMTAVTSTTAPVVATSVPMTTTAPVVAPTSTTSVPIPTPAPAVAPPSTSITIPKPAPAVAPQSTSITIPTPAPINTGEAPSPTASVTVSTTAPTNTSTTPIINRRTVAARPSPNLPTSDITMVLRRIDQIGDRLSRKFDELATNMTRKIEVLNKRMIAVEMGQHELRGMFDREISTRSSCETRIAPTELMVDNGVPPSTENLYNDVPEKYKIPFETLRIMQRESSGAQNFGKRLAVRLFPELMGPDNLRYQYSYNGGGVHNKKSLDDERKSIIKRYVLYFHPEISSNYQSVINSINEGFRRPEIKRRSKSVSCTSDSSMFADVNLTRESDITQQDHDTVNETFFSDLSFASQIINTPFMPM